MPKGAPKYSRCSYVQNISNGHQNKSVKCEPPLMPRGENHKEEEECDWIYYLAKMKENWSFESALVSLFGVNGIKKKNKNQLRWHSAGNRRENKYGTSAL